MIRVDSIRRWPTSIACFKKGSCHLFCDSRDDLPALHAFARNIGLKRSWFQPRKMPHYDLTISRRAKAILAGAVETSDQDTVQIRRNWQRRAKASDVKALFMAGKLEVGA